MTLQQAFDHARTHLLAQNAKAVDELNEWYVLLDAEGRRCALGCFIPPEYLIVNDIGGAVSEIVENDHRREFFAVSGLQEGGKLEFFRRLMDIYDRYDPADWREEFDSLAEDFGLTVKNDSRGEQHGKKIDE